MNEDQPKKRKKRSSKPSTKLPPHEGEAFDKETADSVKDLISDILSQRLIEVKKLKETQRLDEALSSTVGEFLECFTIIGYDSEGQALVLTKTNTHMQRDALHTLLIKYFSLAMQKNQQNPLDDFSG